MEPYEEEALDLVMRAAEILGWDLAFYALNDDPLAPVEGVVIGTEDYITNVLGMVPEGKKEH